MLSLTPTINEQLPFKVAGFDTLVEGLEYAARGETGYNFYSVRGELTATITYTELRDRAKDLALRLASAGFPRHGRVAILAETLPQFHIFFFACQYAGLLPVPLRVRAFHRRVRRRRRYPPGPAQRPEPFAFPPRHNNGMQHEKFPYGI